MNVFFARAGLWRHRSQARWGSRLDQLHDLLKHSGPHQLDGRARRREWQVAARQWDAICKQQLPCRGRGGNLRVAGAAWALHQRAQVRGRVYLVSLNLCLPGRLHSEQVTKPSRNPQ